MAFLRPFMTTNDHGDEEEGETHQITQARAKVLYGTGQERRDAAQTQANMSITILCNWTPLLATVTETDKARFADALWDLRPPAMVGENDEIHFTAIRSDQGD